MLESIMNFQFLRYAYITGLIIAIVFPLLGSYLVIRRQTFISDTLSHVSLAGISFAFFINLVIPPTVAGIIAAVCGGVIIEFMRSNYKGFKEITMMIVMSVSIAFAITLASLSNTPVNISSYLFGSINTIQTFEFYTFIVVSIITLLFIFKFYYPLLGICTDEVYSKFRYKNYYFIKYTFIVLTATIIALSIKVIGALIIGALIVIPVAASLKVTNSLKQSQIFSIIFSELSVMLGLVLSYYVTIPSGASIILFACSFLIIINLIRRII